MGLLGRKKRQEKEERHSIRRKGSLATAFDSMKYYTPKDASDQSKFEICDMLLQGYPVLANFNNVPLSEVNEMLAFISGVVYAMQGEIYSLGAKLFLFGGKESYEDGTLIQYIEDTK